MRGVAVALLLGATACGGAGSKLGAPAVAPIVRAATPSALRPPGTASWLKRARTWLVREAQADSSFDTTTLEGAIKSVFLDAHTKISGGTAVGLVNASLEDLDSRVEGENRKASACFDQAPAAHRLDFSSVATALDLTLQVQCIDKFGDGSAAAGGIVVGKSNDDVSLWLDLAGGSGEFGYFANVTAISTTKAVDFLFVENAPTLSRASAYRVKAAGTSFELTYASSTNAGDNLQCGLRLRSDGASIWAEGLHTPTPTSCTGAVAFAKCYKASDLTEDAAGCAGLKSFTMSAIPSAALATAGSSFAAALPIGTAASKTTAY